MKLTRDTKPVTYGGGAQPPAGIVDIRLGAQEFSQSQQAWGVRYDHKQGFIIDWQDDDGGAHEFKINLFFYSFDESNGVPPKKSTVDFYAGGYKRLCDAFGVELDDDVDITQEWIEQTFTEGMQGRGYFYPSKTPVPGETLDDGSPKLTKWAQLYVLTDDEVALIDAGEPPPAVRAEFDKSKGKPGEAGAPSRAPASPAVKPATPAPAPSPAAKPAGTPKVTPVAAKAAQAAPASATVPAGAAPRRAVLPTKTK